MTVSTEDNELRRYAGQMALYTWRQWEKAAEEAETMMKQRQAQLERDEQRRSTLCEDAEEKPRAVSEGTSSSTVQQWEPPRVTECASFAPAAIRAGRLPDQALLEAYVQHQNTTPTSP